MISPLRFGAHIKGPRYSVHYIPNQPKPNLPEFQDTLEKSVTSIAVKHGLGADVKYDFMSGSVIFTPDGKEDLRLKPSTPVDDIDFARVAFLDPDPKSQDPAHDATVTQHMAEAENEFVDSMFKQGFYKQDTGGGAATLTVLNLAQKLQQAGVTKMRMEDAIRRAAYMDSKPEDQSA